MNIDKGFHKLRYVLNPDIQLSLAKPNKKVVGHLTECFATSAVLKLGQIHELSFSIPYYVEKNFNLVKNKNVDKIKQRYLIKATFLGKDEWFVITSETDDLNDTNIKNVTAFSLGYQLSDKYIRQWAGVFLDGEYQKESLNAKQVMGNILAGTSWSYDISKSDSLFLTRYRSFDFSNATKLDIVFNIAQTFNAVIEWDTHNKKIIFHDAEKYGTFRGLYISDNKYLSSYEKVVNSEEMATRLYLYGKDGLTVEEYNSSGMSYIEDLTYFLKGFNMDSNGNVTSHSTHVEDDLCKAIIAYQNLIESKDGHFIGMVTQRESIQSTLSDREFELFELDNELKAVQSEIDIANALGNSTSTLLVRQSNKKTEITSKQSVIAGLKNQLQYVDNGINGLKNEISMQNNFTPSQLEELDNIIIERTWENNNISDAKELLELGRKELDKINKPNSTYNIGLVYLLRIAEAQKDVKKLLLGDKIRINKREINETVEAQLIEMNINFDDKSIDLTIANFSTEESLEERLTKMLYKNDVATATINMNKSIWDDISQVGQSVNNMLTERWQSALHEITAGTNESVVLNNRGITITDPTDPNRFLRMTNSVIAMSKNGGQTVSLAITPDGVAAEVLTGRILIGQELFMENESGSFLFNNNGLSVKNTAFKVVSDTTASISNGIEITPEQGIVVTKSDNKVRTTLNATNGIVVETKKGTNWNKEFYYDVLNERLIVDGEINARELKINGQNVLTSGKLIKAEFIEAENLKIKSINIEGNISWGKITDKPSIPSQYTDTQALNAVINGLTYIDKNQITSPNIIGGTITGAYLNTTEDLKVGNNIFLVPENQYEQKGIFFGLNSKGASDGYIVSEDGLFHISSGYILALTGEGVTIQSSKKDLMLDSYSGGNIILNGHGDGLVKIGNSEIATQDWVEQRVRSLFTDHINAHH